MAGITSAIGAVASGVGGLLASKSQSKAAKRAAKAAQFNPFNVFGAGGNVTFGKDGTVNVTGDQTTQMFQDAFANRASNIFQGGGFGQGAAGFADMFGTQALPGAMNGALADSSTAGAFNAGNIFSQFAAQNAAAGQSGGMNALARANNFGGSQTGINEGVAQGMFNQAGQAFGNTNFDSLASDNLARQRAFARPGEERAVNSKFQNLFNKGVLSQTGGQRQLGELALSQEMADIQRVNSAEGLANTQMQQNRGFGLNAMQQGLGARNQDQQFNLGAGNLFAGMGQGLMNFGQNAGQAGFATQMGLNNLQNSRGQQRLSNITSLLGFGQGIDQNNMNQALGMFGANQGANADLRQLIALGGNLGSSGAQAGANAGNLAMQGAGSPAGSFLGSIGSGMMNGSFGGFGGGGGGGGGGQVPFTPAGSFGGGFNPFSGMFGDV